MVNTPLAFNRGSSAATIGVPKSWANIATSGSCCAKIW
jgi:hypothetical protein